VRSRLIDGIARKIAEDSFAKFEVLVTAAEAASDPAGLSATVIVPLVTSEIGRTHPRIAVTILLSQAFSRFLYQPRLPATEFALPTFPNSIR